ncbi:hypothetical protein MKX07_007266 [Trichoderma sp. CBMAI-0711]|uniref:DUF1479 domain protein n=1 Tax=Trichoderma parareesei TaxID=858221 RepID=A0A2H2Z170_TRIPA|nr:hypothetical protein MKX07_007266 [Trichoderma sp. CBMAI-0711]OTA01649.1 hypothetical protein A9Z42_0019730 [Trichoderma parareesei]
MLRSRFARASPTLRRCLATVHTPKPAPKRQGDISDSFVSLSGAEQTPLPDRFRQLKLELVRGREKEIVLSWQRLLHELQRENEVIARKGPEVIPQINFADLDNGLDRSVKGEILKRGVVVVHGVIPEREARGYKTCIEEYVKKNPQTRAFPPHDPQVYELYWSESQIKARSHPSMLKLQRFLMSEFWWSPSVDARISLDVPLSYADRLRIRQPGDAAFALGPHIDGGSVERWEKDGYGRGHVYDKVFEGRWEQYDAWDAAARVDAVNNLYNGLGACSAFRAWQGWVSMSRVGPEEGTLLTYPLMMSTAYTLLRPFFRPVDNSKKGRAFLDEKNWEFTAGDQMTSDLQGAHPGHGQELNDELHPHLELSRTMTHVPEIKPGAFVAWHCDTIHAVDKVHKGQSDSSVLYIPVCPVTDLNAEYLVRQRQAFREGTPGPDFPGGEGESKHIGRPTEKMLWEWTNTEGRRAMGLEELVVDGSAMPGARAVVERFNATLGLH